MTREELVRQGYMLLMSLLYGMSVCFLYDTIRSVRCGFLIREWKAVRFLMDCVYGILAGFSGFFILLRGNDGILRAAILIAMSGGYIGFEILLGRQYQYRLIRSVRWLRQKIRKRWKRIGNQMAGHLNKRREKWHEKRLRKKER